MSYQILSFSTSPFTQARIYSLLCDTSADLPASVDGYSVGQGWTAKVIEDGTSYIANSSGSWIQQPSSNQFSNVYTKAEIDALFASQDAKIYGHDSVQVNLNDLSWTRSGGGMYYSELITTMQLTKIYALSLSGFANIRETDFIIPACNRTGGWNGFRLYANTNSFATGAWFTVSGIGEV